MYGLIQLHQEPKASFNYIVQAQPISTDNIKKVHYLFLKHQQCNLHVINVPFNEDHYAFDPHFLRTNYMN